MAKKDWKKQRKYVCLMVILDRRGRLVGMQTWGETEERNFQYAIPIDQVVEYIENECERFV